MKIAVYNQEGKEAGQIALPKEIFDLKINPDLIYQVAVSQAANRRQVSAKAKNRGEVSGGGRKPWKQKGTGRARQGSIRSPLWKGGGVTFGPTTERNFKKQINRKMRRKAVLMLLSSKAKENQLLVLNELKIEAPKTKLMVAVIDNLLPILQKGKQTKSGKETILLVLPGQDKNILLAGRNLENVKMIVAKDLNALALLSVKYLIFPEATMKVLKKKFRWRQRSKNLSLRSRTLFLME
ncbi:MAG: 50S ribosomal protein L4 [Candidatus Nealsonbacteria bacterium CG08_land_8_20_14_0_20_43_11]|uniref:Large ribosomal subunit protein uL4 n=1 Tax=Candidatus Nealsonbacteria bacterium CG08_land_8_20_14_0_20_43_11 TaxID=1974706 RepID=A0A2M6T0T8_9BACT|nr:MAG: 50S ribosomal protein L4 [Candidatus Nealsonbacteria bacterium CG08_land_8_20_14_0_20_43_11]